MAASRFLTACATLGLLLPAGCSGPAGTTTGALLAEPAPATVGTGDATGRALQVAATSARAARCGFYFDAGKLRANFLAAEAALGATPEQLQKTEREYDYARAAVAEATVRDPGYCTEQRARLVKADLGRHLAGDFAPPPRKPAEQESLLSALATPAESGKFDPNTFYDVTGKAHQGM